MAKALPYVLMAAAAALALAASGKRRHRGRGEVLPTPGGSCPTIGYGGQLAGLNFIEDVSAGGDYSSALPLIIFFHSRGASMEGAHAMEQRLKIPVRVLTPQGPISIGSGYGWFAARAKDEDQETLAAQMVKAGEHAAAFIAEAMRCFPTVGLPIVTGSSQGAGMAYLIASLYPHLVAGAVGVSGWLPETLWNRNMAYTIALHGMDDQTVPFGPTAEWAEEMEGVGAVEFWAYDGAGHSVTSEMARDWTSALETFSEEEAMAA